MIYSSLLKNGEEQLRLTGIDTPETDARLLLENLLGCDRTFFFLHGNEECIAEIEAEYNNLIKRRADRIPLQYLTGMQEFMGLRFTVNPSVLIPRADTENLVEEAVNIYRDVYSKSAEEKNENIRILDMCTGSGAIALSCLKNMEFATAVGADISEDALDTAEINSIGLGVANRIDFIKSDMFSDIPEQPFDMILSNPPYIRTEVIQGLQPEVKDFEPRKALDGGSDGLEFYRIISRESPKYMRPGAYLLMEIGYDQALEVAELLKESGDFTEIEVLKDLSHNDRVVKCKKISE